MNKKNGKKKSERFLLRLLSVVMVISMIPYQALMTAHAAPVETPVSVEEPADTSNDQADQIDQTDEEEAVEVPDQGDVQDQENVQKQEENTVDAEPAAKDGKKKIKASSSQLKATGNDSSSDGKKVGDETPASMVTLTPEEQAEENYGKDGKAKTFEVSLTDNRDTAEAGQLIKYNIDVTMYKAAFYKYDGQNEELMFTQWENITVQVKLPQVTIPGTDEVRQVMITGTTDTDIQSCSQIDAGNNIWEIVLKSPTRDATDSNSVNLDFNTKITGNGELPDGTVLPEAEVEFGADFFVRIDEDETVPRKQYSKTVTYTTDTIALSTPDEWMMTKTPFEGAAAYTIDKTTKTVTVHYYIKYGLKVGEGTSAVPSEDKNVYTRNGRVPFDHDITLEDTPTLTCYDGTVLDAYRITVTPIETGYIYKDGSSADADSKPKAIEVQSGQPVNLPYAVVGSDTEGVAANTPYFSQYNVDMVYDYDDFMVWYYDNPDNPDDINAKSENTATIKYQLLGQEEEKETQDDGTTKIPAYVAPGYITIEKYIVNYDSSEKNLYTATKGVVTGPAAFQVFEDDGTTPAELYYKDNDKYNFNDEYEINEHTLTIDPSAEASLTNGNKGAISFYLDPGTYIIKESEKPAYTEANGEDYKKITVDENGKATAVFDNKERLGQVKVHKIDDSDNHLAVPNARFGLYTDGDHDASSLVQEATTDNLGNVKFARLIPGTYYLWEISAPDGYIKSEEVKEIEVTENNTFDPAIQIMNHLNRAVIKLQKQYSTVSDPTHSQNVTDDYKTFEKAFTLQQSIDGETWINVTDQRYSLDNDGSVEIPVAKVDEKKRKLMYRFIEVVPEGYYGPNGEEPNHTVTSDPITPANGEDTITMNNLKAGFIELTNKKVTVNASSGKYTAQNQSGKVFKLYRTAGESLNAVEVAEGTTGDDGICRYSGLLSMDPDGKIYTYYVVEEETDAGYIWKTDTEIFIGGVKTPAVTVGSFTSETVGNTLTSVSYNIQQDIVIGIIKKDSLTGAQLANAKFKVSAEGIEPKEITSSESAEAKLQIELGKTYAIKETEAPTGYKTPDETTPAPQYIDTRGWYVDRNGEGFSVFKADGTEVDANEDLTFTFEDPPYKKIRVIKKVKSVNASDENATVQSGVTFSIYTKEEDSFKPYTVDGKAVTINADGTETVSLPEGDYYLHEEEKPSTVVDPDQHKELYHGKGEYADGKFFFGPYTSTIPTSKDDILWDVPVINISNKGDLIVKKKLYNTKNEEVTDPNNLAGFRMEVYRADEDGNPTGTSVASADTAKGGQATFRDLPVYDENGALIRYVVKEVYINNQKDHFYTPQFLSSNAPYMVLGGSADDSEHPAADAGFIENHQYVSVDVVKMYYDAREYELTGLKYELEGAVIALYRNNGDGTYTYLDKTGITDDEGKVSFGKLEYSAAGYVAIEVSVPDRPEYKYMRPVQGEYLQTDAHGNYPAELSEEQVGKLSKAVLTSETKYAGEIDNVISWTQIHITKYEENTNIKLDGANFTLYKQVLSEGTQGGELTFDAENCTVVGEYTSGTWIHSVQPQKGKFQTNVLENADNIVYWLVETKAPSGYSMIDEQNYVLFPREGTNYTNKSNDGKSTLVFPGGLKDNTINQYRVDNKRNIESLPPSQPPTGDHTPLLLILILCLASLAGLWILLFRRRRSA